MKTFWIYLFIFLSLLIATQSFLFFSASEDYKIDYEQFALHFIIIVICALIASFILKKRKNTYNEKAN